MVDHSLLLALLLFGPGSGVEDSSMEPEPRLVSGLECELSRTADHSDQVVFETGPTLLSLEEVVGRVHRLAEEQEHIPVALRRSLEATVAREVAAGERSAESAFDLCRDLPAPVLLAAIQGFVRSGNPLAERALARLAGQERGLDAFIMDGIARLARRSSSQADQATLLAVRFALNSTDPQVRCAAAGAAGALGDDEAVQTLIWMLEDEDPSCAAAAHSALVEHIGLHYSDRPALWQAWYDREVRFLDHEFTDQVAALRGNNRARRALAVSSIAAGRLGRARRARVLAEALPSMRDRSLKLRTLSGLRTLGSPVARPILESWGPLQQDQGIIEAVRDALAALEVDSDRQP